MRVLRILEYVGDERWIRVSLGQRAVKGEKVVGNCYIREGFVGDLPLLGISGFDEDQDRQQEITVDGETVPFRVETHKKDT